MGNICDVIVVGAGPGGSTAAYYLAGQGLDVLLLDKAAFPRDKTCGDGLCPRALPILADMGILADVFRAGCRLDTLKLVAPNGRAVIVPIPSMASAPEHTVIIPRFILDNLMLERAISAGAHFQGEAHVTDLSAQSDGVSVTAEQAGDPFEYRARVAVIATGASTGLLRRMGTLAEATPRIVAARAYFEGIRGLDERIHFRFDGVPMPGYGWLFPLGETSANVGAGLVRGRKRPGSARSPQSVFETFARHPGIQAMLSHARQQGPVKSYPLRTDFATSPTISERVLLVGEAAGLVNPLTGDGIDYAMESGKIAAEHLHQMFSAGDFSRVRFEAYDASLRECYQRLFVFCERVCQACLNRPTLNVLVPLARRHPELAATLVSVVLGGKRVPDKVSLPTLARAVLANW
jgi:menaquinone-9 beta-reductase